MLSATKKWDAKTFREGYVGAWDTYANRYKLEAHGKIIGWCGQPTQWYSLEFRGSTLNILGLLRNVKRMQESMKKLDGQK